MNFEFLSFYKKGDTYICRGKNSNLVEILQKEEVAQKINDFLNKMDLDFERDDETNRFTIHFGMKFGEESIHFHIFIFYDDKWITIVAPLIRDKDLPEEIDKLSFYKTLLRETYYLNEVTYGLTENDDIVVHAETATNALGFDNFKVEFYSVVYGIEHFLREVVPVIFKSQDTSQ